MSKGILVALFCVWFSVGVQAAVQYPRGKNAFAKLDKTLAKMSKKEKAKVLEKIYDFMIKREDYQPVPIVAFNKEPMPDWLNNLFWETSDAGVAQGNRNINRCLEHGAVRNSQGVLYPNSCMFGGNIICTTDIPPKCNKAYLASERPDLFCDDGTVKCNPDVLMTCNGSAPSGSICVDPKKAVVSDPRKGPKITNACVTDYGNKSIEDRAKEVAACADFSEGGKVSQAMQQITKFCSSLNSAIVDEKLRSMNAFDSTVSRRNQRGQNKADFAGNDQDCLDMLNYIAKVQGAKPEPPQPVVTTPEVKPEDPCKDYEVLCQAQDTGASCGSYIYTPGNKQRNECVPVSITQEYNTNFSATPSVCNDEVKDLTDEGRARQMGWIHRTCRGFNWNDRTKIGRSATGSSDGNPERVARVNRDGSLEFKNPLTEGLTDSEGYADRCWDPNEGKFVSSANFNAYIDKTVTNPAQNAAVKQVFRNCSDRNAEVMRRQGLPLHAGLSLAEAARRYGQAKRIWAMMRVEDVTNTHMAVKRTTGVAMRDQVTGQTLTNSRGQAEAICTPSAPCTEGTFICAEVEMHNSREGSRMDIKDDKVAEYVTIYSDRLKGGEYGTTQYVEIGNYRRPDIDGKGVWKNDDKSTDGKKWKSEDCPVSMEVYDAEENFAFLQMDRPKRLTNRAPRAVNILTAGVSQLYRPKQSAVYHAVENVCPAGAIDAGRRYNKVVARKNAQGEIDSGIFVCDSEDGQAYRQWMWSQEVPRAEVNSEGQAVIKNMKMFNSTTRAEDVLNLGYNTKANPPGSGLCLWHWSEHGEPAHLIPGGNTVRVQGSIRTNSRSLPGTGRGIQSEGTPKVVEEPKK